jgi:hypothetical protein
VAASSTSCAPCSPFSRAQTEEVLEVQFDEEGQIGPDGEQALNTALAALGATDLLIFSHGWNNSQSTARELYAAFFGRVDEVLTAHGQPDRKIAYLGVFWPSMRWTDEPIPDFAPGQAVDLGAGGGGGAAFVPPQVFDAPPPPDADLQTLIRASFPDTVAAEVDELLTLIADRPEGAEELSRARDLVRTIATSAGPDFDGEGGQGEGKPPAALPDPDNRLFGDFAAELEELNIDTGADAGAAGFKEQIGRLWHGAQEALRGLTYWQMKKRAGVVGENGLGPLIGRLRAQHPKLSIDLIGHSFGARVVSYGLKGTPTPAADPTPVQSVTLLQGAFSHFAFAHELPFAHDRSGALDGQQRKVAGPVTACFSKFDSAVGVMYPLASKLSGDDAAGLEDEVFRFGGMGHDGHQLGVTTIDILKSGDPYNFTGQELVNIDAQRIVRNGKPPSGAHSDIIYDDLAWVVVSGAGLARP